MRNQIMRNKINRSFLTIPALALLAACTTSGGNIFSNAAPTGEESKTLAKAEPEKLAKAEPGRNPNASSIQKNTYTKLSDYCPSLRIRAGTEAMRFYAKGADRANPNNVRYQATITKVARECNYVGNNLEITIGAKGRVITGPAGKSGEFNMPIRVAIQEKNCSHHFDLHQQVGRIAQGATFGRFQFVDQTISIPAPRELNVVMYIGFDEGPYGKPSTKPCTG